MSGIKEAEFDAISADADWLEDLYRGAYARVVAIYSLRSPSYWANLAMIGQHRLREQLALKEALRRLRKSWRKHAKAKAVADVDPEAADGEPVQPEGRRPDEDHRRGE